MSGVPSQNSAVKLSDVASSLHMQMMSGGAGKLYTQQDLQTVTGLKSLAELMLIIQELVDKNLVKLVKQGGDLKFQAVDTSEAAKKSSMSAEEALVYSYIEASGREGIWSKTIKARTNLHQHVVSKCLKALESQRYVKSVKSVKFPTRKIYMLYSLQPSVEVTGGPWFTEGELDVEFINSLLTIVWRFVAEQTFPGGASAPASACATGADAAQYAPNVRNWSSTREILAFIASAQVANVELSPRDIRALCEVLVYDDKLERAGGAAGAAAGEDNYRVTLQSLLQLGAGGESAGSAAQGDAGADDSDAAGDSDAEGFSVYDYYNGLPPASGDREVVYFDEWTL